MARARTEDTFPTRWLIYQTNGSNAKPMAQVPRKWLQCQTMVLMPSRWLQCQANGSNVFRVLRVAAIGNAKGRGRCRDLGTGRRAVRCRAIPAHPRNSSPDVGLGLSHFQAEVFKLFPSHSVAVGGGTEPPWSRVEDKS